MEIINWPFLILVLVIGIIAGYSLRRNLAKKKLDSLESKSEKILEESQKKSEEIILEAKKKSVEILEESKKKEQAREEKFFQLEKKLEKKEEAFEIKLCELEKRTNLLKSKAEEINNIKTITEKTHQEIKNKLEEIAGFSGDQAKEVLLKTAEVKHKEELIKALIKLEKNKKEELESKALNLITQIVQKYAGSHASEITTSTVSLPSDGIKGRIIGREGRNIKSLEKITGVEIIIDDTPEAVVLSSFDPIRREIARIALEKLIEDGRIHPTKIEDAVEFAKKEIGKKIQQAGEIAVYDLGIINLDPKLLRILGRLKYRTSYGQNVLLRSLEVAHLAGALAAELGANIALAKKAGLLHDIGKAVDHEVEGTHVAIGIKILEKFNLEKEVIDAMKSHHEDYPFVSQEAIIVAAADAISASRPGARKDTLDNYLKRLEDLEKLTIGFSEVEKTYAIQAGREIRVFVKSEEVDDLEAIKLARKIADKIEEDLDYPGEIKVNVLRETRSIEYAR